MEITDQFQFIFLLSFRDTDTKRFNFYIEHFNIISKQYGFRNEIGIQYALLDLLTAIYNKKYVLSQQNMNYISKGYLYTFDTVNHDMLSQSLEDIGIYAILLKIFENYFKKNTNCKRGRKIRLQTMWCATTYCVGYITFEYKYILKSCSIHQAAVE